MRRLLLTLLALVALAAGALWGGAAYAPCAKPIAMARHFGVPLKPAVCPAPLVAAAEPPPAPQPPAISVETVARRAFVDRLFVSGTLVAREEALISAPLDGLRLVEILADDGDRVAKDQVLARLDRSQLDALAAENDAAAARADAAIAQAKSLIEQSQAQVEWATSDHERARKLGPGVVSASTIEQKQTALKGAEAQLAAAANALAVAEADRKSRDAERRELEVRIDRTEIKAPVAGLVSRRSARLGAVVAGSGEPLFRIIADGAIDLEAEAPEQWLTRFAPGMTAELRLPGLAAPVAGHVRLVSQEVDRTTRLGKVRIALDDPGHARVGAFASGDVAIARSEGVALPTSAIGLEGERSFAYVVVDGRVVKRALTLGVTDGGYAEALDGLAVGDIVVKRAAAFLRPGDRVQPLEVAAAKAEAGP